MRAPEPLPEPGDAETPVCSCGRGRHYLHPDAHDALVCDVCDAPDPPKP